ncbi:MAG: hypothetical protein CIT03_10260 [Methanobacterium sp.]|nr:MAG: hypothetical protein CIT03_10260 [Methanobacterium sp.]
MRKPAAIFLMAILLTLSLAGAVSAQEVDVFVEDMETGELVDEACVGSEVLVNVWAFNDGNETLEDPAVLVYVEPEMALLLNPDEAVADFNGNVFINDPFDPFFYWDDDFNSWVFWIGWYDEYMYPDDYAALFIPATVAQTGEITIWTEFFHWPEESEFPIFLSEAGYTFYGVECPPEPPEPSAATVPMKKTGTPLAVAALGILSLIGGVAYSKLR